MFPNHSSKSRFRSGPGELIFHWGAIESVGAGWSNPPPEAPTCKLCLVDLIAAINTDD